MKCSNGLGLVVAFLFWVVPVLEASETPGTAVTETPVATDTATDLGPYQAQVQLETSQAKPSVDRRSLSLTYYHHDLGGQFGYRKGGRLRGSHTHGLHTAFLADLVVETQLEGTGGFSSLSFYHALGSRLHAFANVGFGVGEKFFVRNKQYLELAYVVPVYPKIALAGGLGRNEYGSVSDSQSSLGTVLYASRFVVEYRWIHFDTIWDQLGSNTHLGSVLCQNLGPVDLGVQFLYGRNGYVSSRVDEVTALAETATLGLDCTFWLQRGVRGVKARFEYGQKDKDYHRLGIELSSILGF